MMARRLVLGFLVSLLALVPATTRTATTSSATLIASATYSAHVQSTGWMPWVHDGTTAGTTGKALRMEAIRLSDPALTYRAHVQNRGWMPWVTDGAPAGTTGKALRLEAIQVTAPADAPYRVEYRAHVQNRGWMPWVHDGATAGTAGKALRLEALQIRLVEKDPPVADPIRLAVTADNGLDTPARTLFSSLGRSGADAALVLGDLGYVSGRESDYCRMVTDRVNVPTAILAGNHEGDLYGDGDLSAYAACLPDRLGAIGTYAKDYYLDRGPVRMILISPAIRLDGVTKTYAAGTREQVWLTTAIQEAQAAGRWPVVGMHQGCLTLGIHGCSTDTALTDLLIRENVPLVLTAHDHIYARTHQLTGTVANPQVVDSDQTFDAAAGTVFAVVGNGGRKPREISPVTPLWAAASGTNSPGGITIGYGQIDVVEDRLTWTFVRTSGGTLTDSFTVVTR